MYVQHLANIHKNVRSVKNYVSGAKSFVRNANGNITPFDSYVLVNLIKGVARLSFHVPSRPPTLSPLDVRTCADDLAALGPGGGVARAALLFGVATFLRQSNFVAGPASTAGHLLTRGDLQFHPSGDPSSCRPRVPLLPCDSLQACLAACSCPNDCSCIPMARYADPGPCLPTAQHATNCSPPPGTPSLGKNHHPQPPPLWRHDGLRVWRYAP